MCKVVIYSITPNFFLSLSKENQREDTWSSINGLDFLNLRFTLVSLSKLSNHCLQILHSILIIITIISSYIFNVKVEQIVRYIYINRVPFEGVERI